MARAGRARHPDRRRFGPLDLSARGESELFLEYASPARPQFHRTPLSLKARQQRRQIAFDQPDNAAVRSGSKLEAVRPQRAGKRVWRMSGCLLQDGVPLDDQLDRRCAQEAWHALEDVELSALDVDLDQAR